MKQSGITADVDRLLRTEQIGRTIRWYDRTTSTNTIAAEWAASGAPHGSVVLAEYQTEGRGRLGRSWQAQPGLNLTFSVVLRPAIPFDRFGMVTIAACVAVAEAVENVVAPLCAAIKWPNDVLLNDKKCCGMLLETALSTHARAKPSVLLGVGLNVNQDTFPDELADRATSLLLETGRHFDRAQLMADLCLRLEERIDAAQNDSKEVRRSYMSRMTELGERIRLRFSRSEGGVSGVTLGLDEFGGIVLQTDSGRRVYHAGEVTRSR